MKYYDTIRSRQNDLMEIKNELCLNENDFESTYYKSGPNFFSNRELWNRWFELTWELTYLGMFLEIHMTEDEMKKIQTSLLQVPKVVYEADIRKEDLEDWVNRFWDRDDDGFLDSSIDPSICGPFAYGSKLNKFDFKEFLPGRHESSSKCVSSIVKDRVIIALQIIRGIRFLEENHKVTDFDNLHNYMSENNALQVKSINTPMELGSARLSRITYIKTIIEHMTLAKVIEKSKQAFRILS